MTLLLPAGAQPTSQPFPILPLCSSGPDVLGPTQHPHTTVWECPARVAAAERQERGRSALRAPPRAPMRSRTCRAGRQRLWKPERRRDPDLVTHSVCGEAPEQAVLGRADRPHRAVVGTENAQCSRPALKMLPPTHHRGPSHTSLTPDLDGMAPDGCQ